MELHREKNGQHNYGDYSIHVRLQNWIYSPADKPETNIFTKSRYDTILYSHLKKNAMKKPWVTPQSFEGGRLQ